MIAMTSLQLHQMLPQVFADRPTTDFSASDIWLKDIQLEKGQYYLIEAASGTGKTSLCSFLYGRRQDYLGQLLFDGKDARQLKPADWDLLRQQHIGQLYQEMRLFGELTVMENLQVKNKLTCHKTVQELEQMLDELGIAEKRDQLAQKLSIGQQQRVALIRALCQPLDFLLLDEPISHLDEENSQRMALMVERETQQQGAAVITTSIGKTLPLHYNQTLSL